MPVPDADRPWSSLLPALQERIRTALRARAAAHDALLRDQSALAVVVSEAAAALEAHGAAETAAEAAVAAADEATQPAGESLAGGASVEAGGQSLTPSQLAPGMGSDGVDCDRRGGLGLGLSLGARSPQTAVRALRAAEAEAAAAAQQLEDAWLAPGSGLGAAAMASGTAKLDRGERAASSKDEDEEATGNGWAEEGEEVEGRLAA